MKVNISNQVHVPLTVAQANALLPVIDAHCADSAYAVCEAIDGSIDGVVQAST